MLHVWDRLLEYIPLLLQIQIEENLFTNPSLVLQLIH